MTPQSTITFLPRKSDTVLPHTNLFHRAFTYLTRTPPPPHPHASISFPIHLLGLIFCVQSYIHVSKITNPLHAGVGGSHQFLTIIALTLTTLTFITSLLSSIFPSRQLHALARFFSVIATPLEVLVCTLYWTLHTIDKNLVVPPGHALPLVPNLGLHAVPAITLTLDMLVGHPWTLTAKSALLLDSVFFFAYWGWLEHCYSYNGWFPYPNLVQLNMWQRLLHTISAAAVMVGYTVGLKSVHERLNKMGRKKMD